MAHRMTLAAVKWTSGEVAGREEEGSLAVVLGGLKQPQFVGWVCKEETELEHCFAETGLR